MKIDNSQFVPLHVHGEMSQLDGLSQIKKLVHKSREMGFKAISLTDHGNISGWIKFIQECYAITDKNGESLPYPMIKPILGAEMYVARKMEWKSKEHQPDLRKGNRHLILLAKNWEGYQNLCRLVDKSWTEGFYFDPRIDIDLLAKYSKGLIAGSACLSSVINANLYFDRYDKAKKAASIFKDIFKEDFYLEVMFHGIDAQRKIIPDILKLGKELDIPVCATNDSHYLEKSQKMSQEVLLCMSTSKCLKDPKHISMPYGEFYLKSAAEMMEIFKDIPQVVYNTVAIAEKVDTDNIIKNLFFIGMHLPKIDIPQPFNNPQEYMEHLAWEGMKELSWGKSQKHIDRLKMEIADVKVAKENNNYDFATYFLIVRDYINYAKSKNILVGCGRGSGFASILLRCLGITWGNIDPMESGLWERFLGFSEARYMTDSDFGFGEEKQLEPIVNILDIDTTEDEEEEE